MKPRIRLLRQLGAGVDGTAWAARDEDTGASYTLHRLRALAEDHDRLRALAARVRLLDLVAKRGALAVRQAALEQGEPWLLVERGERTFAEVLLEGPLDDERFHEFAERLVDAVVEAHRVGLVIGAALRAGAVVYDERGRVALDLAGVDTGAERRTPYDVDRVEPPTSAADVAALADLLDSARTGRPAGARTVSVQATSDEETRTVEADPLAALLRAMRDPEPAYRPSAAEVQRRLGSVVETRTAGTLEAPAAATQADAAPAFPERLGRYRLLELLGEGAMGRVYRAEDVADGTVVAVKVLARELCASPRALRRFRKEARLLAEAKNPWVANLLEANEDCGRVFLVVEYVKGRALAAVLQDGGPLPERDALAIIADVARALVDVHGSGVVHRDVKPDNILVVDAPGGRSVKLVDFGIARHVDETESLAMTREGALVGTPLYMSPEQCRGEAVDPRTDVYALGTTLFELIVGRAPFAGKGAAAVVTAQLQAPPPRLEELKPGVSSRVAALVARMLAKDPAQRPADARALLAELEAILDGDRQGIDARPAAPDASTAKSFSLELKLRASPRALWPYVSNTTRLNRAVGLSAVEEAVQAVGDEVARFGRARQAGFSLAWKENPFEWIEGRRLGVLREYQEGPLRWIKNTVDLRPDANGGTTLVHTVVVEPRGLVGRAAASFEIGVRTMRAFEKAYLRVDDLLARAARGDRAVRDPFEADHEMPRAKAARLAGMERAAVDEGAPPLAVAALGEHLRRASAQDVARIRPVALARRLDVPEQDMLRACLLGSHVGMLVPLWDLLCPGCRAPARIEDTLRALKEHARCEACAIDFALDLASSIELVFRAHPSLRDADVATYCIGSPAHTPHVAAQVRLAPGEHVVLDLALDEGRYLLQGRGLSFRAAFGVQAGAATTRWEVPLSRGPDRAASRLLAAGAQTMVLRNDTQKHQVVRVERAAARDDALTASRVVAHPLFRRLFPGEVLDDGALLRVSSVTLLLADVAAVRGPDPGAPDAPAFAAAYARYKSLEHGVLSHGGSVVKIRGDGVLAWFDDPADAVRAALAMPDAVDGGATLRAAVHRGAAAAVTLNDRLDYFGRTVRELEQLLDAGRGGELVVSEPAGADPAVLPLLVGRVLDADVVDVSGALAQRFRLTA